MKPDLMFLDSVIDSAQLLECVPMQFSHMGRDLATVPWEAWSDNNADLSEYSDRLTRAPKTTGLFVYRLDEMEERPPMRVIFAVDLDKKRLLILHVGLVHAPFDSFAEAIAALRENSPRQS